jgi:hypothetical protein
VAGKVADRAPCSIEIVKEKVSPDQEDQEEAATKTKTMIMEAHH